MIEPEDLILPDTPTLRSQFSVFTSATGNPATLHLIGASLSALESAPVIGAFDANHLQQIHACIFQDAFPRAGHLRAPRPSSLSSSLDNLFDRLAGENRLKGLELDPWSKRATRYLHEIELIKPFDEGSDITAAELFRTLASENGFTLRWTTTLAEFSNAELQMRVQSLQGENPRRLLILAVDPDLSLRKPISGRELYDSWELIPFL